MLRSRHAAPAPTWLDSLGQEDPGFGSRHLRWEIEPALEALDARERQIVVMRFWGEMVQSQIAHHMGISQMHVSRLIRRSLLKMRDAIEASVEMPRRDRVDPEPRHHERRPSDSLPPAA